MDLRQQQAFLESFHDDCLAITNTKGPDYAPDNIPLLDMCAACVEAGIGVPQGLWILYRKHFSAIRKHFFLGHPLTSESIEGRLADAANYFGFLALYEIHKQDLFAAWARHWMAVPCACESSDLEDLKADVTVCQRCDTLAWMVQQGYKLSSVQS